MTDIRKKTIEGLKKGDTFSVSRTFTRADVHEFAGMTKDYNPVHFDDRFIKAKGFDGPICHGLLVGGMLSEIGGQIGWLASEMGFNFIKPVFFGDTIVCKMTITDINEKGWAEATAEYRNQDGTMVMKGNLKGIIPKFEEREIMRQMMNEAKAEEKN